MHWNSIGEKKSPYGSLFEILNVSFQQNKCKSDDFGQE